MADPIAFTPVPVKLSAAAAQPVVEALDVGMYDELELLLAVSELGSGGAAQIEVQSTMDATSSTAWVTAATFTTGSTAPTYQRLNIRGPLRYVRYNVKSLTASSVTFAITGLARRWR